MLFFSPTWGGYVDSHTIDNGRDIGSGSAQITTVGCGSVRAPVNRPQIEGSVRNPSAVHFSGKKTAQIQDNTSLDIVGQYTLQWELTVPRPAGTQS